MIHAILKNRKRLATALLWIVPLFWATNYLISKSAAGIVPPHVLAFGRWGVVCATLFAMSSKKIPLMLVEARLYAHRYFVLAIFGMWICGAWVYMAGVTTSATNIGLIYSLAPIFISIVSFRINQEAISYKTLAVVLVALFGVFLILCKGSLQDLISLNFVAGDLWILSAMISWVCYSSLLKHWKTELDGISRLALTSFFGSLILLPFAIREMNQIEWVLSEQGFHLIFLAALLPGLISYLSYAFILDELGAIQAGVVMYLAPVYNSLIAWSFFSEDLNWYHFVGAVMILPSLLIISHLPSQKTKV